MHDKKYRLYRISSGKSLKNSNKNKLGKGVGVLYPELPHYFKYSVSTHKEMVKYDPNTGGWEEAVNRNRT